MTINEPVFDVAHLGNVELFTPKPAESLAYFTNILSMQQVHAENQSIYLRGYGDYAATTLKLTEASDAGIGIVSWRATSEAALERRVAAIAATGRGIGWNNGDFGRGRSYRFKDPDGHVMEIYYDEVRYVAPPEQRSTLDNLPMRYPKNGVGAKRLDHVALCASDVGANRQFVEEALGLRLREQVMFEEGTKEIGAWMSSNNIHHQIAYVVDVHQQHNRMHHLSLWLDDRDEILRAADIFAEHGITMEAGPAKHNNSQAFYIYTIEPGGNRIEVYTSGFFVVAPDWEPVVWDEARRGRGVYWGATLPDSFLQYATPNVSDAARPKSEYRTLLLDPQ
jgi:catechol 2,3-dioxygenase